MTNLRNARNRTRLCLLALLTAGLAGCGPSPAPPPDAARGKTLYATNGCAACHGAAGRGDGTLGKTLTPHPTDFTASTFGTGQNVEEIARIIQSGRAADPTPMPAYDYLPEADRRDMAAFVLSLAEAPAP
ncbi:MAG: cytochrome c [Vicinamibacterales bacterium]